MYYGYIQENVDGLTLSQNIFRAHFISSSQHFGDYGYIQENVDGLTLSQNCFKAHFILNSQYTDGLRQTLKQSFKANP